jgi:antitoxin MazE
MIVRFAKWGNSIAVRIPAAFAKEIAATDGATAEMSVVGGKLVVTPVEGVVYRLEDLVDPITDDMLHNEIETGEPVGGEIRW